jgi:methionyl-tRNA formyltransferase
MSRIEANIMDIVIATVKSWNIDNALKFKQNEPEHNITVISEKDKICVETMEKINPNIIFFPHWSWIIPKEIYKKYECVVFHMADLPCGRGGSPLQNQIAEGIEFSKISAIKVDSGIDTGDIYFKRDICFHGSAEEIFMRASKIVFEEMIPEFLKGGLKPLKQQGMPTEFKRRKKNDGEIKKDFSISKIYDYIRMLDAEGYPNAYIEFGNYVLEFSRASLKHGEIKADVIIKEKE